MNEEGDSMASGGDHEEFSFEQLAREDRLAKLEAGDIFHATDKLQSSLICLVVNVSNGKIFSRRIPTQENIIFDRKTGFEIGGQSLINSIEPLLEKHHNIFINLDRRYRLGKRSSNSARLTNSEKEAFLFAANHYPEFPI